jgi:hypothetical protein
MALNISNLTEYIRERIAEFDSEIDTADGTAIADLLVKPITTILQPLVDEIQRISDSQSLRNASTMSEDELDALVANLFVSRRTGGFATGIVRIFSVEPIDILVPVGAPFLSSTNVTFLAASTVDISKSQMRLNREGSQYYAEIPVIAENPGEDGNVSAGSIVTAATLGPDIVRVTNPAAFTGGSDRETNEELAARAAVAITTRDMVTEPGIETILLEEFDDIIHLRSFGFGDPEMERDLLTGTGDFTLGGLQPLAPINGPSVHIGGKVDIVMKLLGITAEETDMTMNGTADTFLLRAQDEFDETPIPANYLFVPSVLLPAIRITKLEEVDPVELVTNGNIMAESATHDSGEEATIDPNVTLGTSQFTDPNAQFLTTLAALTVPDANIVLEVVFGADPQIGAVSVREFVIDSIDSDTQLTLQGEIDASVIEVRYRVKTIGDYDVIVDNPSLRFSERERIRIVFRDGNGNLATNITNNVIWRISYEHVGDIPTIQGFVDADENRVVSADLLAKFTEPAYFSTTISWSSNLDVNKPTDAQIVSLISTFINGLEVGERVEASDIVNLLYENGVDFVQVPFDMTAVFFDRFGVARTVADQNIIEIPRTATLLPDTIVATEV